ncbi:hypothetical protein B0H13DRAFT_1898087 [Mycena leptocephala]|nr:hypothetical protein B0H13DRAFT_1898087 [Mycena leptocephala]
MSKRYRTRQAKLCRVPPRHLEEYTTASVSTEFSDAGGLLLIDTLTGLIFGIFPWGNRPLTNRGSCMRFKRRNSTRTNVRTPHCLKKKYSVPAMEAAASFELDRMSKCRDCGFGDFEKWRTDIANTISKGGLNEAPRGVSEKFRQLQVHWRKVAASLTNSARCFGSSRQAAQIDDEAITMLELSRSRGARTVLPDSRIISAEGQRRVAKRRGRPKWGALDRRCCTVMDEGAALGDMDERWWHHCELRDLRVWVGSRNGETCMEAGIRASACDATKIYEREESGRMRIRETQPKIRRRVRYADSEMRMHRSGWNEDEEGCRGCGNRFEGSQTGGLYFDDGGRTTTRADKERGLGIIELLNLPWTEKGILQDGADEGGLKKISTGKDQGRLDGHRMGRRDKGGQARIGSKRKTSGGGDPTGVRRRRGIRAFCPYLCFDEFRIKYSKVL